MAPACRRVRRSRRGADAGRSVPQPDARTRAGPDRTQPLRDPRADRVGGSAGCARVGHPGSGRPGDGKPGGALAAAPTGWSAGRSFGSSSRWACWPLSFAVDAAVAHLAPTAYPSVFPVRPAGADRAAGRSRGCCSASPAVRHRGAGRPDGRLRAADRGLGHRVCRDRRRRWCCPAGLRPGHRPGCGGRRGGGGVRAVARLAAAPGGALAVRGPGAALCRPGPDLPAAEHALGS